MGKDGIINLHQTLHQNLYHILSQNLQNLCHDVHHHKQNMKLAVNGIMLVLNKQAIAEVKVILQLTKMRKISIGVSMKKNVKADRGVDPLMNIEEGENNHTMSKVVHDL